MKNLWDEVCKMCSCNSHGLSFKVWKAVLGFISLFYYEAIHHFKKETVCLSAFRSFLPSLLESSGVLWTLFYRLRQGGWSLFTWRHTALKRQGQTAREEWKQNPERQDVADDGSCKTVEERKIGWVMSKKKRPSIHHTGLFIVTFDVQLTLVCEDVMLPEWAPRRDFWLLCGVPLRGETYGRGDDASDVRETGDWLECWAETGRQSQCRWEVDRYNALLPIQSSYTNVNAEC